MRNLCVAWLTSDAYWVYTGDMSIPRRPQKVKSVRRSVTIPKAVDVRMRVRQDVNWSAVAAQAFQKVLDELEKKNGS